MGDGHCKWKRILPAVDNAIKKYNVDRIVFVGDLCDEWDIGPEVMLDSVTTLKNWTISHHESNDVTIDVLIGNHDVYYLYDRNTIPHNDGVYITGNSPGHRWELVDEMHDALLGINGGLSVCTTVHSSDRTFILSHAGFTRRWVDELGLPVWSDDGESVDVDKLVSIVNGMMADGDWGHLYMVGKGRGGMSWTSPSPLWADLKELRSDPLPLVPQIVGHTPVESVEMWKGKAIWPEGALNPIVRTWPLVFCDTMSLTSAGFPIGNSSCVLVDSDSGSLLRVWLFDDDRKPETIEYAFDTRYEQMLRARGRRFL